MSPISCRHSLCWVRAAQPVTPFANQPEPCHKTSQLTCSRAQIFVFMAEFVELCIVVLSSQRLFCSLRLAWRKWRSVKEVTQKNASLNCFTAIASHPLTYRPIFSHFITPFCLSHNHFAGCHCPRGIGLSLTFRRDHSQRRVKQRPCVTGARLRLAQK